MMISSTIQKNQVPTHARTIQTKEDVKPSLADSFAKAASSEMPRALLYSAAAGATAGVVTSFLAQGGALQSLGEAAGLGAAAGAGVGLIAGVGMSLFAALSSEEKGALKPNPDKEIVPPRLEPILTPPPAAKPSPEKLFRDDAQDVGKTLSRRLQSLDNLIEAEKVMQETLGRRGRDIYRQAEVQVKEAKSEYASKTQDRPPAVALEKETSHVEKRLSEVQVESRQALRLQLEAEKISSETLNRMGRYASQEGEQLHRDLQREIGRLEAALKQS